jgi:cell division protein FtsZ
MPVAAHAPTPMPAPEPVGRHYHPPQPPRHAAPAQDEFDLEDIFDEAPAARTPQPAFASQRPAQRMAPPPQPVQQAAPLPPEPAWQPEDDWQPAAYQTAPQPAPQPAPHQGFAPPRRAATPAPEVVERLRRAVENRPAAPAPAPVPASAAESRSRFGTLGSLINRMTGHAEAPAAPARPQPSLHQPAPQSWDEPAPHAPAERSEIPAFLRRQAN